MPANILSLTFKTPPSVEADMTEVVGSPQIGEVEIRKMGCLTPNEKIAWDRYALKVQNDLKLGRLGDGEFTTEIVTMMLQSRYRKDWNRASTEALPNYPLIEALFRFFDGERSEWTPSWKIKVEGFDGKDVALNYAKENGWVVLQRKDILFTYIVVDYTETPAEALLDWEVVEDYTPLDAEKASPSSSRGKQRKSTGEKSQSA